MPDLIHYLDQSAALHQHLCPRQVLGVRMGLYAAELLDLDLPQTDKRLFTFVETDGCFADGVSVTTGCWLGRRTLRLVDYGKAAATFVDIRTGRAIRIWPDPRSRILAPTYAPQAHSRWRAYLDAYQIMPVTELLCVQPVILTAPLERIISRAGVRVACAACGEEIINEREITLAGQILCRSCAGGRYYQSGVAPEMNRALFTDSRPGALEVAYGTRSGA
ncbi:MAG: formylmethanofuran dehydrogenase [Chloroflexi bacterium]|nr:formylmethanofuran dehydrogenase [Chloroflexota bacterium]